MPCQPEWARSNSWLGTKPDLQHRTLRKPTHLCIMSLVSLDAWAAGLSMTLTKWLQKACEFHHVHGQHLPAQLALHECRIREQAPKGDS